MSRNRSRYQEKNPPFIKPLHPRTDRQAEYLEALRRADQVVVMGPAGTGKTYIASALAASLMLEGKIDRIILTRPNVPAGRSLGALPGTLEEKIAPWVIPFTDVIKEYMGYDRFNIAMKKKNIDVVPFEVMRGRTFDNAFVILDEAQNTTPEEMKMFLTRTGEDSTVVINGDISRVIYDRTLD